MKRKESDLTDVAILGYQAREPSQCPYRGRSAAFKAWHAGRWLQRTGRSAPRLVETERGSNLWVNDMLVAVRHEGQVERLS